MSFLLWGRGMGEAIDGPAHAGPPRLARNVLPQPRIQGGRERVVGQGHGRMRTCPVPYGAADL